MSKEGDELIKSLSDISEAGGKDSKVEASAAQKGVQTECNYLSLSGAAADLNSTILQQTRV